MPTDTRNSPTASNGHVGAAIALDAREARPFGKRMIRFITIGR
jgi:hypothetical protein